MYVCETCGRQKKDEPIRLDDYDVCRKCIEIAKKINILCRLHKK